MLSDKGIRNAYSELGLNVSGCGDYHGPDAFGKILKRCSILEPHCVIQTDSTFKVADTEENAKLERSIKRD